MACLHKLVDPPDLKKACIALERSDCCSWQDEAANVKLTSPSACVEVSMSTYQNIKGAMQAVGFNAGTNNGRIIVSQFANFVHLNRLDISVVHETDQEETAVELSSSLSGWDFSAFRDTRYKTFLSAKSMRVSLFSLMRHGPEGSKLAFDRLLVFSACSSRLSFLV